jgi:ketosteroid isomerase-like protein
MSIKRAFVLVAVSSLLLTACGSDTTNDASGPVAFEDRNATGESLANAWFELLSLTGSPSETVEVTAEDAAAGAALVKPFLDPAFQLQRATGQRYTRDNYIPSDIDEFEISDVFVTEPRDDIKVLRYAIRTPGATVPDSSMVMSKDLAPRLTVVRWDEEAGRWLIVSHANFNTPIQAVCNQETIELDSAEVATSNEDRELGEKLARTWFDLLIAGDGSPLLHPEVQGQSAAGTGYTTSAEYVKGQMKSAEFSDFVVTRDGDLIIVTLGVDTEGTVFAGSTELGTQKNARLLTFLQDDQGEWKLIATATFNPPAEVPAEVECAAA